MFDITDKLIEYFKQPYKLNTINRFQTEYHIHNETVAAHSYYVTLFVIKLYEYYKFDLFKAMNMALIHDLPESFIGDFPYHIKQTDSKIQKVFNKLDDEYIKKYNTLRGDISQLMQEFNDCKTIEARIVNYADMLSSYLFCLTEQELGNNLFIERCEEKFARCIAYEDVLLNAKR